MSKTVQWKRGNAAQTSSYIGADGEITVNTTKYALNVHDGVTPGGHEISSIIGNGSVINGNLYLNSGNIISDTTFGLISNYGSVYVRANNLLVGPNLGTVVFQNNASGGITTARLPNIDLSLTANTRALGMRISSTNGHMGFNDFPSDYFDYNFKGGLSSGAFYSNADSTGGYLFKTLQFGSGLTHYTTPSNQHVLRITHENSDVAKFIDNGTSQIRGNLVVSDNGSSYGVFPTAFFQLYSNVDTYSQFVSQNLSSNELASTDIVITADNGTDTTHYLDMGIASSNYNYPGYGLIKPNDAYIYSVGPDPTGPFVELLHTGNLLVGSVNGNVKLFVGTPEDANVVAQINSSGMIPGSNVTQSLGSTDNQWKDLWVSNVTATTVLTSGVIKTGVFTASSLPLAATVGAGARAFVTDSSIITFGANVSNGGSNNVPVYSDGVSWRIG